MGYQFYGMLMESWSLNVARLHAEQLTPINQSLVPVKNGKRLYGQSTYSGKRR